MQLGYSAPHNENCEVRNNVIVAGGLSINNYRDVVQDGNVVIGAGQSRPTDARRASCCVRTGTIRTALR